MNLKYFITVGILFLSSHIITLMAQDFRGGISGGGVFSQVDGDSYGGYHKPGVVFGGFVSRKMSRYWDLQFEINYKQKGAHKIPDPENGDYNEYKIATNYLEVPLMGKIYWRDWSFEGGLSYGTLLNSKEWDHNGEIPESLVIPFETYELASLLGMSYHFTEKMWINIRFSYSLNRVRYQYSDNVSIYNPHIDWRKSGQYNNNVSIALYYSLEDLLN